MKKILKTAGDVAVILAATVFAMMFGGIWLDSWEFNKYALPIHYFIAPFIYLAVFLLESKLLFKKLYKHNYIEFPPKMKKQWLFTAIVLVVLFYLGAIISGCKLVFPKLNMNLFLQNLAGFIGTFIIAPFIEEVVFRGVILGQVEIRYNKTAAIIVSSLLFGAAHLTNGSLDFFSAIQLVFSGTLVGILFGVISVSENSIWASFAVHALYNGIGSILVVQSSVTNDWFMELILTDRNRIITGGEYGFDCGLTTNIAFVLTLIIYIILKRKKHSLRNV